MKSKIIDNSKRKSLIIKESGRSSDYISPSFGFGCLADCSYCYMKRHKPNGLSIAKNVEEILYEIGEHHSRIKGIKQCIKPNQTDDEYITYDISCNEDFALHYKYHNWKYIFDWFKFNEIKPTFATKFVVKELLNYNPEGKIRIRFSLMPQILSDKLEKNTSLIEDRIKAINEFKKVGYDVHINYSPVIIFDNWEKEYENLFKLVDSIIENKYKSEVKSEVIFLTHNITKHIQNTAEKREFEHLLWTPNLQEFKVSSYGGENVRYKSYLKSKFINKFKEIHHNIIPWNKIRYIF